MSALANVLCAIVALIFGLFFGNFCTSFYYRVTNKMPIFGMPKFGGTPPHCSLCKHPLKFFEYLPIFNWFSIKDNRCNYCGAPIDSIYNFFEFGQGILALVAYLALGFTSKYIFVIIFSAMILLSIVLSYKKVDVPIYLKLAMGFLGMIYDAIYVDEMLSHVVSAAAIAAFIPQIALNEANKNSAYDFFKLQNDIISLVAVSVIWVSWYIYIPLFITVYCLCKQREVLLYYIYPMILLPTWIFVIL